MKLKSKALFLCIAILSFGCGDDDTDSPSYDFKDQVAQGSINGQSWTFVSGRASISDEKLSIDLAADSDAVPCETFSFAGLKIFFTVDNKVALTELFFDLENFEGKTATFFDPDDGEFGLNIIAVEGAIEILSITDNEVKGRIDVRDGHDNTSSVNGNFTVEICQ